MRPALFAFFLTALSVAAGPDRAQAQPPLSLPSGLDQARATIPVQVNGRLYQCVLDTGTSVMLVSPSVARGAGLFFGAPIEEIAPDGLRYSDYHTQITTFSAAAYQMHGVAALISPKLTGDTVLCGYDFFAQVPTLIDLGRQIVTLFPSSSTIARMHCLSVDLAARVPVASINVNGITVEHVVLDSGLIGGAALWAGVANQLGLSAAADFGYTPQSAQNALECGRNVNVSLFSGSSYTPVRLCVSAQPPDGYNGIMQTNLPNIQQIAVDYPNRRICFSSSIPFPKYRDTNTHSNAFG